MLYHYGKVVPYRHVAPNDTYVFNRRMPQSPRRLCYNCTSRDMTPLEAILSSKREEDIINVEKIPFKQDKLNNQVFPFYAYIKSIQFVLQSYLARAVLKITNINLQDYDASSK